MRAKFVMVFSYRLFAKCTKLIQFNSYMIQHAIFFILSGSTFYTKVLSTCSLADLSSNCINHSKCHLSSCSSWLKCPQNGYRAFNTLASTFVQWYEQHNFCTKLCGNKDEEVILESVFQIAMCNPRERTVC